MNAHPDNQIVAGVDGSPAALDAARWAARVALGRRARLTLFMAYDVTVGFAGPGVLIAPDVYSDVRHSAETVLARAADILRQEFPDLEVSTQLRRGAAARVLVEATESALLTVVGASRENPFDDVMFGSVAPRLAAHARGPVVVVRDRAGIIPLKNPVSVGIDGSVHDEAALAFALEEASLADTSLVALHCWGEEPATRGEPYYAAETADGRRQEQEERLLAERLAGWSDRYPDVKVIPTLLHGRPVDQILRHCRGISPESRPSVIVVGSRGRGAFKGLLLGSTSRALIAHAPCPVAVVRSKHDER